MTGATSLAEVNHWWPSREAAKPPGMFVPFLIIGCATNRGASFVISHIYLLFILAPLILGQYLDYIHKLRVKSFVLLAIDMLLLLCAFRCTV